MDETDLEQGEFRREHRANTLEGREDQLIAYAVDLAERQLREGTASAQVITHFLKLGSSRERTEQRKLEKEIALAEAKIKAYEAADIVQEKYDAVLKALKLYGGSDPDEDDL